MKLSKNKKLYLTSSWQRGFSGFNVRNESRKLCVSTAHTHNIILVRKWLRHSRGFLFIKW